ncbi:MAG TPA: hypothetical protein DF712_05255, partial [Balneola sp.]|nr:hypothetical protein [Balneola sp.]
KVSKRNKTTSYSSFGPSEYTMSYKASPEYTNTQNSMSYAKIDLVNLEPLTGDIYSVKTYRKSQGEVSDWKIVDTSELTANNLLVDNANNTPDNAIGIFTTQNIIDSHWELDNSDNSISGEVAMARSVDPVINSLRVELGQVIPEKQSVRLKTSQSFSLYSGGNYVLSFDAYSNRESLDNNLSDKSLVNVYMSGSAFDWKGQREVKGKRIDFLETYDSTKRWEDYEIEFQTNQDGQATLIFDIDDGMWDFSNIQLRSKQEPGYTPNHVSITVPIDTRKINDEIDFKFEYYDYKGNQCSYTTIVEDQSFAGGNVYIEGSANLLTGSLFVGNVVGKGIEQSGKNSGYIRSVGYPGWNEATASGGQSGFLMFSGSIGLGDAGNDYKGVGMEMVSGNSFFRYRTNPSALQIQSEEIVASGSRVIINTPTFFLGEQSNYISGSGGNLTISSSALELQSLENAGYLMSTGYRGFTSASNGTGPGGFLIWSGSALSDINNDYYGGTGLELHGGRDPGGTPYTSSGILQFRTDTQQLFIKGTLNTRFEDGRTMNPAIPYPERLVIDDSTNSMKFYLTGSAMRPGTHTEFDPVAEIGSGFEITHIGGDALGAGPDSVTGLIVTQPTSKTGSIYVEELGGQEYSAVIVQTEATYSQAGTPEQFGFNVSTPFNTAVYRVNATSSVGGDTNTLCQLTDFILSDAASFPARASNESMTGLDIRLMQIKGFSGGNQKGINLYVDGGYKNQYGIYCQTDEASPHIPSSSYSYYARMYNTAVDNYGFYATVNNGTSNNYGIYIAAGDAAKPGGGSWSSTSDARVKSIEADYTSSLSEILKLSPKKYQYNGSGSGAPIDGKTYVGLIAQEAELAMPSMVRKVEGELTGSDGIARIVDDYRVIDTSELTYTLINAIKDQQQIIEDLKSRIERLEGS